MRANTPESEHGDIDEGTSQDQYGEVPQSENAVLAPRRLNRTWTLAIVVCVCVVGLFATIRLKPHTAGNLNLDVAPSDSSFLSVKDDEQTTEILCDDFAPLGTNGCCANNKCPTSCGSKSVSESNGETTCQCQHCPEPESDEEACEAEGKDEDDRRRLSGHEQSMRLAAKSSKFFMCLLGKAMARGKQELAVQLDLPASDRQGLDLLGLLASGAAANSSASATAARRLFSFGGALSAAGSFVRSVGQQAVDTVKTVVHDLATSYNDQFCNLLMPMCDCSESTAPMFTKRGFEFKCVGGGPFAEPFTKSTEIPLLSHQSDYIVNSSANVTANIDLNLQITPEFSITVDLDHFVFTMDASITGSFKQAIHSEASLHYKSTFLFPEKPINSSSCFQTPAGVPVCLMFSLQFPVVIELAGKISGHVEASFEIDANVRTTARVPLRDPSSTTFSTNKSAHLTQKFDMIIKSDYAKASLQVGPTLMIIPLPSPFAGIDSHIVAQAFAEGEVKYQPDYELRLTDHHFTHTELSLQPQLENFHHKKGLVVNVWWNTEVHLMGMPDDLHLKAFDYIMNFTLQTVFDQRRRIENYLRTCGNLVMNFVSRFLDMLQNGAEHVVRQIIYKISSSKVFNFLHDMGWEWSLGPHMCKTYSFGSFEDQATGECPFVPPNQVGV